MRVSWSNDFLQLHPSKVNMQNAIPPAWRIEGRATPFSPWMVLRPAHKLESALAEADRLRRVYRFYVTRVRAA